LRFEWKFGLAVCVRQGIDGQAARYSYLVRPLYLLPDVGFLREARYQPDSAAGLYSLTVGIPRGVVVVQPDVSFLTWCFR
jgi:hypothetical protein